MGSCCPDHARARGSDLRTETTKADPDLRVSVALAQTCGMDQYLGCVGQYEVPNTPTDHPENRERAGSWVTRGVG